MIKKKIVGETTKIFNTLERFLKGISYNSSKKKKRSETLRYYLSTETGENQAEGVINM